MTCAIPCSRASNMIDTAPRHDLRNACQQRNHDVIHCIQAVVVQERRYSGSVTAPRSSSVHDPGVECCRARGLTAEEMSRGKLTFTPTIPLSMAP